jgi:hypothetical protein
MNQSAAAHRSSRRTTIDTVVQKERRARRRCAALLVLCEVVANPHAGPTDVLNLSAMGISLALPARVPPGTVLHLRLSNRRCLCAQAVLLHVIWCRGQQAGPCLVGGQFESPLPHHLLMALLS